MESNFSSNASSNGGEQQHSAAAVDTLSHSSGGGNQLNSYNPYFSESNNNIIIPVEFGANSMPHQLQFPAMNPVNFGYNPFNDAANNNIQINDVENYLNGSLLPATGSWRNLLEDSPADNNIQFECGGNPNPMLHQLQRPPVNEHYPMDYNGNGVDWPQMANFNNISSDFNVPSSFDPATASTPVFQEKSQPIFIPKGFKFKPKDEQLISLFLRHEVYGSGSNAGPEIIRHLDIYNYEPTQLKDLAYYYEYTNGKMYFYTPIKKKGERKTNRIVKSNKGYWKATQAPKPIKDESGHTIGSKMALTYVSNDVKTSWLMYEYKLHESQRSRKNSEELVLAVVYEHKGKSEGNDDN